jgi:hypothetical protein
MLPTDRENQFIFLSTFVMVKRNVVMDKKSEAPWLGC